MCMFSVCLYLYFSKKMFKVFFFKEPFIIQTYIIDLSEFIFQNIYGLNTGLHRFRD